MFAFPSEGSESEREEECGVNNRNTDPPSWRKTCFIIESDGTAD